MSPPPRRSAAPTTRTRRGRPPKFGRPSELVALTLPSEVVRGLQRVHPDLGWAIVMLFEKRPMPSERRQHDDVELVSIADGRFLITVNPAIVKRLPGVQIIPLSTDRAFLALAAEHGIADLELAVRDRLEDRGLGAAERRALQAMKARLAEWRRDPALTARSRAIIVVERNGRKAKGQ